MTDVRDTRRRAEIRGRESVARWRIESGVWSGRLFAVIYSVLAILPLLSGGKEVIAWRQAISLLVLALALLILAGGLANGVWGTFALASARRDADGAQ